MKRLRLTVSVMVLSVIAMRAERRFCQRGFCRQLIKMSGYFVYYLGADGKNTFS
jgi:hypothetical protein